MALRRDSAKVEFADKRHATDDVLERYAMGRLPEPELAEFEEHLLVCPSCQNRLAHEDNIRQRVRDGAAVLPQPRAAVWRRFPKLAWAASLAAVGLAVFAGLQWQSLRSSSPVAPAVILLQTTRGTENPTLAAATAGKPLTVVLDLSGLPQLPEYTLEIVDAAGHPVFQTERPPLNNRLPATLGGGLAAGAYFVRVYSPAHELLREYALVVRG